MPITEEQLKAATNAVISDPAYHARMIRSSHAVFAIASIEDPNPAKAVGFLYGTVVEYAVRIGMSREQCLDLTNAMYALVSGEQGERLRAASERNKG